MNPRFSITVPLYNKAPYVRKALQSVCNQTYTDWECLIIDDGSTDGSVDVVRDFIHANDEMHRTDVLNEPLSLKDGKIRLISQANSGVAATRNKGEKESKGEYLCFLDADDWWEPTFLEEMDKLIAEYPDAGIYCTNYIYYKPGKTHVAIKHPTGYMNYPETYLHGTAMPICTGATCMPRKIFDEMGGFPVGIKLGEDFLLWARTALHYPVAFCEKALAYYNNDVPSSLRATRNLHEPKHHMLFNLQPIEAKIECYVESVKCKDDWKALLDKLRVSGLMEYWLDERYHDAATEELKKVDWSKQPASKIRMYKTPIWILKAKRRFMQLGSFVKQWLLRNMRFDI